MNAERLHAALLLIKREAIDRSLEGELASLQNSLQNYISSQNTDTAAIFRKEHERVRVLLQSAASNIETPIIRALLEEIKATPYLGNGLLQRLDKIFQENNVTPANAITEIQKLRQDIVQYTIAVSATLDAFTKFEIKPDLLQPGQFEVGVSIPRGLTDGSVRGLSDELKSIDRLFATLKEIAGEGVGSVNVKTISSSEWQIFLENSPATIAVVVLAIERVVALYKTHLEIRKLKKELDKQQLPQNVLASLQEYLDGVVKQKIREIAEKIVDEKLQVADEGRKNELKTQLSISLTYLALRLDRGATFEVRAEPPIQPEDTTAPEGASPEQIALAAQKMEEFKKIQGLAEMVSLKGRELAMLERSGEETLKLSASENNSVDSDKSHP